MIDKITKSTINEAYVAAETVQTYFCAIISKALVKWNRKKYLSGDKLEFLLNTLIIIVRSLELLQV